MYGEFTYFMVKLLKEDALDGASGILKFDDAFESTGVETEEFDKNFPPKIKEKRPGQFE